MRNLLIVIQKKVKSSIDSQNVKFDEKILSGYNNKMGAKGEVFVNLKKVRNLWVNM